MIQAGLPRCIEHTYACAPQTSTAGTGRNAFGGGCKNCGRRLKDRFCGRCGQEADVHVPTIREFFSDAFESLTHSDSRDWHTLKLLVFKPGELTFQYIAGRRVGYLPPLRLYFVLSVIFFSLTSLSHPRGELIQILHAENQRQMPEATCVNTTLTLLHRHRWRDQLMRMCDESIHDHGAGLLKAVITTLPNAILISLPFIAFLHKLMYVKPRHRYAEHLLFFTHIHAFVFFVMTLWVLSPATPAFWPVGKQTTQILSLLIFSVIPPYYAFAIKRVFDRSWRSIFVRVIALALIYVLSLAITFTAVFAYTMLES